MLAGSTTTSGSRALASAARSASARWLVSPIAARRPLPMSSRIHRAARPLLDVGGCGGGGVWGRAPPPPPPGPPPPPVGPAGGAVRTTPEEQPPPRPPGGAPGGGPR